uniref:Uncharacterized protein n=1 Tax=Tetranychus urticae TaxID=32264 RepID=T1L355_TETUR
MWGGRGSLNIKAPVPGWLKLCFDNLNRIDVGVVKKRFSCNIIRESGIWKKRKRRELENTFFTISHALFTPAQP